MRGLWTSVRTGVSDPLQGIFGPDSISWNINRESALFLGAGRAALLQLAHPWVAAALDQHSNLRHDPLARFHNTFRVVFTMIFGSLDQALAASRHLYQLHTHISGTLPEPAARYAKHSHYQALDTGALTWVFSTLVESALLAHDLVLPPLSAPERQAYYAESQRTAALFGIAPEALPSDWDAFERYNQRMWDSDELGASPLSRGLAQRILKGKGSLVPIPEWYRALTIGWLPPRLRDDFGFRYEPEDDLRRHRAMRRLPRLYNKLPGTLRFVGPYHEAKARIGHRRIGTATRLNNRFWMGQTHTMFPELAESGG